MPAHYDVVGQALILTFSQTLKEKFNDTLKNIWVKIFNLVRDTMLGQ